MGPAIVVIVPADNIVHCLSQYAGFSTSMIHIHKPLQKVHHEQNILKFTAVRVRFQTALMQFQASLLAKDLCSISSPVKGEITFFYEHAQLQAKDTRLC